MYYVLSQDKRNLVNIGLGHIIVCEAGENYKLYNGDEEISCNYKYCIVFVSQDGKSTLMGAYETETRRNSIMNQLITTINRVPHGVFAMPEK